MDPSQQTTREATKARRQAALALVVHWRRQAVDATVSHPLTGWHSMIFQTRGPFPYTIQAEVLQQHAVLAAERPWRHHQGQAFLQVSRLLIQS